MVEILVEHILFIGLCAIFYFIYSTNVSLKGFPLSSYLRSAKSLCLAAYIFYPFKLFYKFGTCSPHQQICPFAFGKNQSLPCVST